jgi:hypothetical protein
MFTTWVYGNTLPCMLVHTYVYCKMYTVYYYMASISITPKDTQLKHLTVTHVLELIVSLRSDEYHILFRKHCGHIIGRRYKHKLVAMYTSIYRLLPRHEYPLTTSIQICVSEITPWQYNRKPATHPPLTP